MTPFISSHILVISLLLFLPFGTLNERALGFDVLQAPCPVREGVGAFSVN